MATRERKGMELFRKAFTAGTTYGDGATLCADSHTLLSGDTQDNKLTAALSVTSLESAIIALSEQKGQDGVIEGRAPRVLLVPSALYKDAVEITDSELVSDSADNALNVYSAKYGITVLQSPFLGTAVSDGSNTAWFLLGDMHGLERHVREELNTVLVPWQQSRSHQFAYTGRYREVFSVASHIGLVGSDGTA